MCSAIMPLFIANLQGEGMLVFHHTPKCALSSTVKDVVELLMDRGMQHEAVDEVVINCYN